MTLRNLKNSLMSLYWANMSKDVKNYSETCIQCIKLQPIKKVKVNKMIIPNGPFDRFTADLWEIPKEMIEASATEYRYVLSCVDHFSKYKWTELVKNKEGITIAEKLEYFFNYYSPPKILQTDNGREFENSSVRALCQRKNVKFIHGSPYHPKSQGVVEKLNDLLSKSLFASFQAYKKVKENVNHWDIEIALKAWTASSNRNVHSVTGQIPIFVIVLQDSQQIEKIKTKIKDYYNKKTKNGIDNLEFKVGMRVFIINELKKKKNEQKLTNQNQKVIRKKRQNDKSRIPAKIVDISSLEFLHVKVKVCGNPTEDILLDQVYSVAIDKLEIARSEKSWMISCE